MHVLLFYLVEIVEKSGNDNVIVMELDLASLASVRKCAAAVIQNEPKLHILINNAGCSEIEKKLTVDGLELQMQSNHFGHFLLTNLLLGMEPRLNILENVCLIFFFSVSTSSFSFNF